MAKHIPNNCTHSVWEVADRIMRHRPRENRTDERMIRAAKRARLICSRWVF